MGCEQAHRHRPTSPGPAMTRVRPGRGWRGDSSSPGNSDVSGQDRPSEASSGPPTLSPRGPSGESTQSGGEGTIQLSRPTLPSIKPGFASWLRCLHPPSGAGVQQPALAPEPGFLPIQTLGGCGGGSRDWFPPPTWETRIAFPAPTLLTTHLGEGTHRQEPSLSVPEINKADAGVQPFP